MSYESALFYDLGDGLEGLGDAVSAVRFDDVEETVWLGSESGQLSQLRAPGLELCSWHPAHRSSIFDLRCLEGCAASASAHALAIHASGGVPRLHLAAKAVLSLGQRRPAGDEASPSPASPDPRSLNRPLIGAPPSSAAASAQRNPHARPPLGETLTCLEASVQRSQLFVGSSGSSDVSVMDLAQASPRLVSRLQAGVESAAVAIRGPALRGALLLGTADGHLVLLDPRAGGGPQRAPVRAHVAGFAALDARGDAAATTGYGLRAGSVLPEPVVRLWDLRMGLRLRADLATGFARVGPLSSSSPPLLRFLPEFLGGGLLLASPDGRAALADVAGVGAMRRFDLRASQRAAVESGLESHFALLTALDLSPTGQVCALGDEAGGLSLLGAGPDPAVAGLGLFPALPPPPPTRAAQPLALHDSWALAPRPAPPEGQTGFASDLPPGATYTVSLPVRVPDPKILAAAQQRDFLAVAPAPSGGAAALARARGLRLGPRPNQASALAARAERARLRRAGGGAVLPGSYAQPVSRGAPGARFLGGFEYESVNATPFVGLENDIANSYVNALVQALYFVPGARLALARHVPCLAHEASLCCELALLARLLDARGSGGACQASSLLRALRASRDALGLGLLEGLRGERGAGDIEVEATKVRSLARRVQSFARFLLERLCKEAALEALEARAVGGPATVEARPGESAALEARTTNSAALEARNTDPAALEARTTDSAALEARTTNPAALEARTTNPAAPEARTTDSAPREESMADPRDASPSSAELVEACFGVQLDQRLDCLSHAGVAPEVQAKRVWVVDLNYGAALAASKPARVPPSLAAPPLAQLPAPAEAPLPAFGSLVRGALQAEQTLRAWLNERVGYAQVKKSWVPLALPATLLLGTGDLSAEPARRLWIGAGEARSWPPPWLGCRVLELPGGGRRLLVEEGAERDEVERRLEDGREALRVELGGAKPSAVGERLARVEDEADARSGSSATLQQGSQLHSSLPRILVHSVYALHAVVSHVCDEDDLAEAPETFEGHLVAHIRVPRAYLDQGWEATRRCLALARQARRDERAEAEAKKEELAAEEASLGSRIELERSSDSPSEPGSFLVSEAAPVSPPRAGGLAPAPASPLRGRGPASAPASPPASPPRAPSSAEGQWHLFNDFAVAPCSVDEVYQTYEGQKLPALLAYVRRSDGTEEPEPESGLDASSAASSPPRPSKPFPSDALAVPLLPPAPVLSPEGFLELCRQPPLQGLATLPRLKPPLAVPLSLEELPGPGALFGLDAEFVQYAPAQKATVQGALVEVRPARLGLARVSVVRGDPDSPMHGRACIDDVIRSGEPVHDYLTPWSGLRAGDLDVQTSPHALTTFRAAYLKLRFLADAGCVFVGHGLKADFRMLNLLLPRNQVVDTADLWSRGRGRKLSLRFLASFLLKQTIQQGTHDSIEDALAALRLYELHRALRSSGEVDATIARLYDWGAAYGYGPVLWADGKPRPAGEAGTG